jgi:transposase
MYQPLPPITEDLGTLQERLRQECNPQLKLRLHLLVLLKSGHVQTRQQAAAHLALHRNTITGWLQRYRHGGLEALLTLKEPGAPPGQKTLPAAVFEQLKARLTTSSGFASYLEVQQWLREECGVEVPYKTLHGIVRYQLKAKLKRPRPRHAKKTRRKRLLLSSTAPAASARLRP